MAETTWASKTNHRGQRMIQGLRERDFVQFCPFLPISCQCFALLLQTFGNQKKILQMTQVEKGKVAFCYYFHLFARLSMCRETGNTKVPGSSSNWIQIQNKIFLLEVTHQVHFSNVLFTRLYIDALIPSYNQQQLFTLTSIFTLGSKINDIHAFPSTPTQLVSVALNGSTAIPVLWPSDWVMASDSDNHTLFITTPGWEPSSAHS